MNPIDILEQYYDRNSKAFEILTAHGSQVARKALKVAEKVSHLGPDKVHRFQKWVEMFED